MVQTLVGHSASTVYGLAATADRKCVVTGISVACPHFAPSPSTFTTNVVEFYHECCSLTGCTTSWLLTIYSVLSSGGC